MPMDSLTTSKVLDMRVEVDSDCVDNADANDLQRNGWPSHVWLLKLIDVTAVVDRNKRLQ